MLLWPISNCLNFYNNNLNKEFQQSRQVLLANGWTAPDIDQALKTTRGHNANRLKAVLVACLGLVVLGVGVVFARQLFFPTQSMSEPSEVVSDELADQVGVTVLASPPTAEQPASQTEEVLFSANLAECTPYKMQFAHLLTGELLEKEVQGIVLGKCVYVEQMPNGGTMRCAYSETERRTIAQFYADIAAADSVKTEVSADLSTGQHAKTYLMNGNP